MESKAAASMLAALSQETRVDVVRALVRAGPEGLAAGCIAERVGAAGSTLSFHLKELAQAGLARARRDGRRIIYTADYDGLRALIEFLMMDCCAGDPEFLPAPLEKEPTL